MPNWGNAFSGGASGAAAGSAFGPWGAAAGGILGGLGGLFGGDNEEKGTDEWLNQIPEEMRQYLGPYIDAGRGAIPHLNELSDEYQKMYQDPNSIISRIGAGYRESPGYKWRLGQGEQAITNSAAAGGMLGTGQHQQQAGELAGHLADQDYQNYLEQALGLYRGGLQGRTGIEQNIFGVGANAAGDLAGSLGDLLNQRAKLNYERSASRNKASSDMWSNLGVLGKNLKDYWK